MFSSLKNYPFFILNRTAEEPCYQIGNRYWYFLRHPRGGNFEVKSVKFIYFLKYLLNSRAWFRQTKYIVMMTKEGSTQIVNFMTPWAEVLVQRYDHIIYI